MSNKTNTGLVSYAKAQLGKPYWYGTFGQAASEGVYIQKKRQYPQHYKWAYPKADEGIKVHDCVGLIKGYIWCESNTDKTPSYIGFQDKSANGMRDACKEKGNISSIPELPGVLVFMDHHVGVYIGNGEVIEARGHAYGVVKTKLKARRWTSWGKCPYISYGSTSTTEKPKTETITKKGATTVNIELLVLRKGENRGNEQIKTLQRLLKSLGYYKMDVDGAFGNGTKTAVEAFQKARKLDVDGICGKDTWTELLKG